MESNNLYYCYAIFFSNCSGCILGSNVLDNLNLEFKNLLTKHPTAIVSLVETKPTIVQPWGEFTFVEPSSAGIYHPDFLKNAVLNQNVRYCRSAFLR